MPSADRVLPRVSRLFWSHPRDDGARLQEDGQALCCCRNSKVGT